MRPCARAQRQFATFRENTHHLEMQYSDTQSSNMRSAGTLTMRFMQTLPLYVALICVALAARASADVVSDVRGAVAQNNLAAAESVLSAYRTQHGATPEYADAYSWLARGALNQHQYDQATEYARQTKALVQDEVKQYPLDSEPHLPLALGASLEVQSQALAAQGQKAQAVILLQTALRVYGSTSIRARLQKNLNLLEFQGRIAPALKADESMGAKLPAAAVLKGSPMLLFFWAHWCGDCKAEAPIITQLRSEFAPQGLKVIGPTRLYGYTAQVEHASPSDELQYIDAVRHRFYSGLLDMPVPISKSNFDVYGASTTPTLVLVDRAGKVAWYHPGALPYAELKAEIEKVVR
jgi:thiol-disulfide isomerase/thioredoxin